MQIKGLVFKGRCIEYIALRRCLDFKRSCLLFTNCYHELDPSQFNLLFFQVVEQADDEEEEEEEGEDKVKNVVLGALGGVLAILVGTLAISQAYQ